MTTIARAAVLVLVASTLAGCAANRGHGSTAYDRACNAPSMTEAAAREAFWCWRAVGAASYEEFVAARNVHQPAVDGERIEVAAAQIGNTSAAK